MNWRPDDWNCAAIAFEEMKRQAEFGMEPSMVDLIEAGANAILGALCVPDNYMDCYDQWDTEPTQHVKGWLVFIPEEVIETSTDSGSDESPKS